MKAEQADRMLTMTGFVLLLSIFTFGLVQAKDIVKNKTDTLVSVEVKATIANAKEVRISGSFNGWHELCCLRREGNSDTWSLQLTLRPGVYEYILIIDGEPNKQKSNDGLRDGLGGKNQILYVNDAGLKRRGGNA